MKSKNIYILGLAAVLSLNSCIEETSPSDYATADQIASSSSSLSAMVDGLAAKMVEHDTYGGEWNSCDWGYPCEMLKRESMVEDFPMYDTYYSYQTYTETNTYMWYPARYTFYYYYSLINSANSVINMVADDADAASLDYRGVALAYRAMAYLDIARMFEYRKTGIASLDDNATGKGCYSLTVPIVSDNTTQQESYNNPRAPFYTMYRFIMNDLNNAETELSDYTRTAKSAPDQSVVYGLKARLYLEMASRFDKSADDLALQLQHENDADGYAKLGITSATDCYKKASEYADKAINCRYTPVTKEQWHDTTTGFNTPNDAWMWAAVIGNREQVNAYYYTFIGEVCSETDWGMPQYGDAFRCIGKSLFDKISDSDWRKTSWVAPEDADLKEAPAKYKTLLNDGASNDWSSLPEYANLKFRPGSGDVKSDDKYNIGLLGSLPLMRVEEMYFIKIEAIAHTNSVSAAVAELNNFMNTYRYTDGSYNCTSTDMDSFIDEMMVQKRIEFWGEGILYFDYKRLCKNITRNYTDTNYSSECRLNFDSQDGKYVAPWLNYYIPDYESDYNTAVVLNPDPSNSVVAGK